MNTIHTICIVDDDEEIRSLLSDYLRRNGFSTCTAGNAAEFLEIQRRVPCSLIVMDIMLPGMNGLELFRTLRAESTVPVIFLTALGDITDRIVGLELGADDYMVKPFDAKEVVARIKAVLRRCQNSSAAAESTEGVIEFDNLRLDMNSYELRVKGKVVEAPPKELELLNCLASHPNRVYTRDQLLDEVWGFEYYGDSRTIDVHVKRLREKLAGASDKWELKTVWGVGYKFEVRQ